MYFIIFNSLGQQSFREEFHFVLFQRLKKNCWNIFNCSFCPCCKDMYICQLWNSIHCAGCQKNQIDGGKQWWNRYESFTWISGHNELYNTTALFSQPDALKFISICVIYWNIILISTLQHGMPIWFYTNSVCTAEGKRRSSHLLTCAWKSCIINEIRKEGPHLGRWSSRLSLLIWIPTVNFSASILQMHQVQGKIHLPETTAWLKIKTCNLQCVKCQCSWNAS